MGILTAFTRRRLLGGAGALSLLPAAPGRAAESRLSSTRSREEHVLDLVANVEPNGGEWQPVTGGHFVGARLSGDVLPGGTLRVSTRHDGVHVVEARCMLRTRDGHEITLNAHALMATAAGDSTSLRAAPDVEAPSGSHAWLNRALLVGLLDASRRADGRVSLRIHRLV